MNTAKRAAILLLATGAAISGAAGTAFAQEESGGASAVGYAEQSPGVGSGNVVQVPVDIPVQEVGNTANLVGFLNPAFGNIAANL
jgi:hypothetical protein